jgi:hypothetical protein
MFKTSDKKYCPLTMLQGGPWYCNKEQCAWWMNGREDCAVAVIADKVDH